MLQTIVPIYIYLTQWVAFGKEQTSPYNIQCEKEADNVYDERKALGSELFTRGDEKSFNG